MDLKRFYFLCRWFDRLSKTPQTNKKVQKIKQHAIDKVDETTQTLYKVEMLQHKVIEHAINNLQA